MKLTPMIEDDIYKLAELEKKCFAIPWSQNAFYDELSNKLAHYFVLRDDKNSPLGYCGMWNVSGEGHITNIAVHPNYRRRGFGSILMEKLISAAESMDLSLVTLEVRESNTAAQNLYKKYGFKVLGRRRGYYADNREDAYIMTKNLSENRDT